MPKASFPRRAKNGETITTNVQNILRTFPETRNNDRLLFGYYWALIDEVSFDDFDSFLEGFKFATPPSSLQRVRQIINYEAEKDNFLPTDEKILDLRMKKAEVMRNVHGRIKLLGEINYG